MEKARGRLRWLADNWVLLIAGLALAGACTTFGYLLGKNLHNSTW